MGAVLTPVLDGLAQSRDLPFACTMNGRCAEVCPVQIPLPTLLRAWRGRSWREGLEPGLDARRASASGPPSRAAPLSIAWPAASALASSRFLGRTGWIRSLPLAGGWTDHRDLPSPSGGTFMQRYKADRAGKKRQ